MWFSARALVDFRAPNVVGTVIEERIILVKARTSKEALETADRFFEEYCSEFGHRKTPFLEVYEIEDEVMADGTEVFSRVYETSLDVAAFACRRYPHLTDP